MDVPGLRKDDVKIEVEENRFLRRFRLSANADLDAIKAHLEDAALKISVLKLAEDRKRQPKANRLQIAVPHDDDVLEDESIASLRLRCGNEGIDSEEEDD
ncbi:unnamed protein product [Thlaspi arvense]|uniref:SHSP domain-containing protein n=1 Tax=Thlaspi arvense TaxID=13288 RepID=A0AAU9RLW4_THLAR|nr:unnamed protein product [Thlaspi arvense]